METEVVGKHGARSELFAFQLVSLAVSEARVRRGQGYITMTVSHDIEAHFQRGVVEISVMMAASEPYGYIHRPVTNEATRHLRLYPWGGSDDLALVSLHIESVFALRPSYLCCDNQIELVRNISSARSSQ